MIDNKVLAARLREFADALDKDRARGNMCVAVRDRSHNELERYGESDRQYSALHDSGHTYTITIESLVEIVHVKPNMYNQGRPERYEIDYGTGKPYTPDYDRLPIERRGR